MKVELTYSEIILGAMAGVHRRVQYLKSGLPNRYQPSIEQLWGAQIEGALAEQALAKGLNKYFAGKGEFGQSDLEENIECRATAWPDGRLIIYDSDKAESRYYLLVGKIGCYDIIGSIYGWEGKKEEYLDDPTQTGKPAYYVPQSELEPYERES